VRFRWLANGVIAALGGLATWLLMNRLIANVMEHKD
jgi:hypothetical protein